MEKVRKKFDQTEVELIQQIIMQGIRQGKFDVANIRMSVDIIHYCIRGLELPYIYGRLGTSIQASRPMVKQVIHRAMAKIVRPDEDLSKLVDRSVVLNTAKDLLKFDIIDGEIKEPTGGAHKDYEAVSESMKSAILESLDELSKLSKSELKSQRYNKYRKMGVFLQ